MRYSYEWHGFAEGHSVSLYMRKGLISGRIQSPNGNYLVSSTGLGNEVVLKAFKDNIQMHPPNTREKKITDSLSSDSLKGSIVEWNPGCNGMPGPGKHFIDVLFLYTPEAASGAGGVALLETMAHAAVADANATIDNSGITNAEVRLAGLQPAPNGHGEDSSTDLTDHLDWVAGTQDVEVDTSNVGNPSVIALRDQYYADVVTLLLDDAFEFVGPNREEFCGLAFIPYQFSVGGPGINPGSPYEPFAYSVVELECAIGFQDFTHELGHLLGLNHDPRNSQTTAPTALAPDPACPGSYGHRDGQNPDPALRFRTAVASYIQGQFRDGPLGCVGGTSAGCPGQPVFSNPNLAWTGANGIQPAELFPDSPRMGVLNAANGDEDANNWLTFEKMAPLIANYRVDMLFSDGFESQ
ncbi:MAG: M12 family metallo-peptidase [Xanthomonadales bacterium]|nr:M12 family metallo-peptidase [Xanthomonadales bacterium]